MNRISKTAARVAVQRAAHQLLDSPRVLDDPLALRILGKDTEKLLRQTLEREQIPGLQSVRAFLVARSRLAEELLARLWSRGVRQYVVLGAGLDTFACRNTLEGLTVFEADLPDILSWKQQRLKEAGIPVPDNVVFAPLDLERDEPRRCLEKAGLRTQEPIFCSMLGLTVYLSPQATMSMLGWAANLPAPGGVFFDYHLPPELLDNGEKAVLKALAARAAGAGEPFKGFFEPARLRKELTSLGFTVVEEWDTRSLNLRYFSGREKGFCITGGLTRMVFAGRDII